MLLETKSAPSRRKAASEIVVFHVDGIACGMDIRDVQEIKKIHAHTRVQRAPPWVRGLVNMRGQIVTLVDVGQRLGLAPRPVRRAAPAIVVVTGDELIGLLVDEVDDVITVDPDDLMPPPANLGRVESHFFSAVVRTSSELVAVVDKERLSAPEDAPERRA